jgi:hypothetical protein
VVEKGGRVDARAGAASRSASGRPDAVDQQRDSATRRALGTSRAHRTLSLHAGEAVKEESPDSIVTYVNHPPTEYQIPGSSMWSPSTAPESRARLPAYLARLHSIAGEQPLLLAKMGLDSQASGTGSKPCLDWQLRAAFDKASAASRCILDR